MTQSASLLGSPDILPRAPHRLLELMLTSGGDERLDIDPITGRNRYGTRRGLVFDEVWFASSTASSISPRGYAAAEAALQAMTSEGRSFDISFWLNNLRHRLVQLFGIPGTEVILTGSGTDAELIALTLAKNLFNRPLTNLIVAPAETGSGVPLAAGGRHFLHTASCSRSVARGERLAGFESLDVHVNGIEIRSGDGRPRNADAIDEEATRAAEAALSEGRAVMAHVLDASKTGRTGLRRSTAAALFDRAKDRVLVLIDACQLRCSPDQIRADLNAGSIVMITGSKFAGGPPFAGALLLPPSLVDRLARVELPSGLGAYSADHDWPALLRARLHGPLTTHANLGLGLRWEAALAELEAFFQMPRRLRRRITETFGSMVRAGVMESAGLSLVDETSDGDRGDRTIFPIVTHAPAGHAADPALLQDRLRSSSANVSRFARRLAPPDRAFHVGQPVVVGEQKALRICLSAPLVVGVADRLRPTTTLDHAMKPLADDLAALFQKWSALRSALD